MNELEFLDDRLCVTSAHSHDGVRHCAARLVSSGACCPDCGRFCQRRHSFTTRWMLQIRRISSSTYLGVRQDDQGALIAHSWTMSRSEFVTGEMGHESFRVTQTFYR